jgi:hypothetical protein
MSAFASLMMPLEMAARNKFVHRGPDNVARPTE